MHISQNTKEHEIITYATSTRVKLTRLSHLKEGLKDIHDIKSLKLLDTRLNEILIELGA